MMHHEWKADIIFQINKPAKDVWAHNPWRRSFMERRYLVGIDQSTQGTKAVLLDETGSFIHKTVVPHQQIINGQGWVEHDAAEIARNVIDAVRLLFDECGVDKDKVAGVGIANQRETVVVWERATGRPLHNAIVWQCNRAAQICERIEQAGHAEFIRQRTGLRLSPFFSAAKIAWILEHMPYAAERAQRGELCCGTIDSWVIYNLTDGKHYKTDCSNASRTQLYNIAEMKWDEDVCRIFGIPLSCLPQVCDSDAYYGETDFGHLLNAPIPIHSVIGDSHGAMFAHRCYEKGMSMTGYGTGSCVLMNIGDAPILSKHGISTSIGWRVGGKICYVFDGVINYSGAVITWLLKDVRLIDSPAESEHFARLAHPADTTYLVPAFSGIGAPYWASEVTAAFTGMTRLTGKAELVRAAVDCIAYQINDVIEAMSCDAGVPIIEMRVSGAPTRNGYLMQFQSDLLDCPVLIPNNEELSGIGTAYIAGLAIGMYGMEEIAGNVHYATTEPRMAAEEKTNKLSGWKHAVGLLLKGKISHEV
jgi:glycerol kinase